MDDKIEATVNSIANKLQLTNLQPSLGNFDKISELLLLVKHLPALYDSNNSDFKNRDYYWIAISNVLKCRAIECKNRFKYLRERYAKEKRIYEENDKSFPAGIWSHYEELSFLEPYVRFRMHRPLFDDSSANIEDQNAPTAFMSGHVGFLRRLISAVKDNPVLYDKSLPEHKNQKIKSSTWLKIATELNNSSTELQLRWKSIRDRAGKERNEKEQAEQDGSSYVSRWCFERDCQFLYPYIKPRRKRTLNLYSYDEESLSKKIDAGSERDVKGEPLDIDFDIQFALNDEYIDIKPDLDISNSINDSEDSYSPKKPKAKRRSKRNIKIEDVEPSSPHFIEACYDNDDPFGKSTTASGDVKKEDDEDDAFGQGVAVELRRITDRSKKQQLKAAIFKMLCDAISDSELLLNADNIWTELQ